MAMVQVFPVGRKVQALDEPGHWEMARVLAYLTRHADQNGHDGEDDDWEDHHHHDDRRSRYLQVCLDICAIAVQTLYKLIHSSTSLIYSLLLHWQNKEGARLY